MVTEYIIEVRINGTDENPWLRMGLRQNPFPQVGKAEYDAGERMLNSLDAEPIKSPDDIRERLKGFDPEFIELCIKHYEPGKRTKFTVKWED